MVYVLVLRFTAVDDSYGSFCFNPSTWDELLHFGSFPFIVRNVSLTESCWREIAKRWQLKGEREKATGGLRIGGRL
jgi:hypothetical protein